MGAKISGIGTSILTIEGVEKLHGARHKVIPDRIEAGSYAVAAAITGGKIELINAQTYTLKTPMQILQKMGVEVVPTERGILVDATGKKLIGEDIITEPFPGFPTDLQAQFMALLTMAEGAGMVTETIFENRFMHVPELLRMGANINVHGHASAIVRGVKKLSARRSWLPTCGHLSRWCWPDWRQKEKPSSTAFTILTAVMKNWKKS